MSKVPQIHRGKQPRRPHFIEEWAIKRGIETQADLVRASGADKGTVSRWYDGASPAQEWQDKLRGLFQIEDERGIFCHPDDDWLSRFFRGREADEIERIKSTLETAFPMKKAAR